MYSKAKQRVLNRLGRRTHLTRNPKVDSLSDIHSGVREDERKIAAKLTSYRRSLRDAVLSGLEVQLMYVGAYKRSVGALKYNAEQNEYTREPTSAQAHFIQQLERELEELEAAVKKELDTFTARFKDYAEHPLTNSSLEEGDELQRIESTKSEYKKARTLYSDRAIEVEAGGSNQAALTEAYQAYMQQSDRVCEEMIMFQERVAREIGSKVRGFMEQQAKMYNMMSERYNNMMPMARRLESMPMQQPQTQPQQPQPQPQQQQFFEGGGDGGGCEEEEQGEATATRAYNYAGRDADGVVDAVGDDHDHDHDHHRYHDNHQHSRQPYRSSRSSSPSSAASYGSGIGNGGARDDVNLFE